MAQNQETDSSSNESCMDSLAKEIKRSEEFKRTVQVVSEIIKSLDIDALYDEILDFSDRRSRRPPLALHKNPRKYLTKYASEDFAYRSRICHLQVVSRRKMNQVSYLTDKTYDWIMGTYGSRMKGTAPIKSSFIHNLTSGLRKKLDTLSSFDEACGMILTDIDQVQWQRKAIVDVLEIESRPEGKV